MPAATSRIGHMVTSSPFLRYALVADAVVSGTVAVLQVSAADWLARWTALPSALLFESGVFLVLYAAFLVALARSARVSSALILTVVIGNVGWAVACGALVLTHIVSPSGLGLAFVLLQIDAVLLFAALQWIGLRRSRAAHTSTILAG